MLLVHAMAETEGNAACVAVRIHPTPKALVRALRLGMHSHLLYSAARAYADTLVSPQRCQLRSQTGLPYSVVLRRYRIIGG